jgi:hypothetical protein
MYAYYLIQVLNEVALHYKMFLLKSDRIFLCILRLRVIWEID